MCCVRSLAVSKLAIFSLTISRHHPFIMFIKMQPLIRNRKVPPSFLQKSYKSSLIHSRWVIRLIEEMEDANLMLYDPFIGYLVAIAATIQLEHTVSKHLDVAAAAKLSVTGAIRYLRKLSKYWRSTENLVRCYFLFIQCIDGPRTNKRVDIMTASYCRRTRFEASKPFDYILLSG
jgi:hypothetical protein